MKFYFVRHGESSGNAERLHQNRNTELSESGKSQAKTLSNRFKTIPVDLIISSPYERAKKTAEIINLELQKPLEISELFRERKRPTEIEGLTYDDPQAVLIKNQIINNFHNPDFRHSDEETFFDLKNRAKEVLSFLEKQPVENILVVTHGDFLRFILGVIIFEEDFKPNQAIKMSEALLGNNTGITLCEFKDRWRVITWNDHAHLG